MVPETPPGDAPASPYRGTWLKAGAIGEGLVPLVGPRGPALPGVPPVQDPEAVSWLSGHSPVDWEAPPDVKSQVLRDAHGRLGEE